MNKGLFMIKLPSSILFLLTFATQATFAIDYISPTPFKAEHAISPVVKSYHYPVITWGDSILAVDNKALFPNGIKVVDNPNQQLQNLVDGKTPFLRQTVGSGVMLIDALEEIGVEMEVFHSVTDSYGGDVIVARGIKNIDELKAKLDAGETVTIAIQFGGPHMGMLVELLHSIGHNLADKSVEIKYTKNLFDKGSAEEAIATDKSIDLAFVIAPGAANLTSGEYAIPDVKVLTSTKVMSNSIKDVIFVRSDWAKENRSKLKKIREAFLASKSNLLNSSKVKEASKLLFGDSSAQSIADLEGLRDDARFHSLKASNNFLYSSTNLNNFSKKVSKLVGQYVKVGLISHKNLEIGVTDWNVKPSQKVTVRDVSPQIASKITQEVIKLDDAGQGEVLMSSNIHFQPNQSVFSEKKYGADFKKAIENAATYGGAVFKIVGNTDPMLLRAWNKAVDFKEHKNIGGLKKVSRYLSKVSDRNIDLSKMSIQLIKTERNQIREAGIRTSKQRANAVKSSIITYAKGHGMDIDASRLVVLGVGGENPIFEKPRSKAEFRKNIRVEFELTNYNSEISEFTQAQDF